MRKLLQLSFFTFFITGCLHTFDDQVSFKKTAFDDDNYSVAFQDATRHAKVIRDFETKYELTATYLSPKFRTAMSKRFSNLYEETRPLLEESSSKAGFLIAIYAPEEDFDLRKSIDASLKFKTQGEKLSPVLIKTLRNKEKWQPFFPYVNRWTKEYLVIFESASVDANSAELVEKVGVDLSFHTSEAEVKMKW